ncbi:hypothetical protein PENSPDRAFT_195993 [Peniophora sp. CONT]|nr:hypothetical protein PENSPDRAFT_195993 [Peniophora sp. CONT]
MNRLADLLFYAWFHLDDSDASTLRAVDALCGFIHREPAHGLKWSNIFAADGLAVSSLVSEYGPQELVQRVKSALESTTRHLGMTKPLRAREWGLYKLLLLVLMLPGICCHVKCRRFLVKYDILPAIDDMAVAFSDQQSCWPVMASVFLSIEEHHRSPDGTPGTYESNIEPKLFGCILMDGIFRVYANCVETLPEEGNRELLVEIFKRHPASSAPLRMQYGFWTRAQPTFWYMCLVGLRSAAYREYGKPAHKDILFLEQSWIEWGEKARIDEKSAKIKHESERIRFCHSGNCPRRSGRGGGLVLSDRPLLACRGCGEARYCDKICQKRAWQEGHRESCRRLPAP